MDKQEIFFKQAILNPDVFLSKVVLFVLKTILKFPIYISINLLNDTTTIIYSSH